MFRIDNVFDNTGPPTSRDVSPVRVEVDSPSVSEVVPIVILSEDITVELAEKFNGFKVTFSKLVICPKVSIAIFFG